MFSKVIKELNSINKFSKNIIIVGSLLSFLLCLVGVGIVVYNNVLLGHISLYTMGTSLIHAAIILFTEFTIGGLAIDLANKFMQSHDD